MLALAAIHCVQLHYIEIKTSISNYQFTKLIIIKINKLMFEKNENQIRSENGSRQSEQKAAF